MNLKKKKRLIAKLVKMQDPDPSKFLYNHVRDDGKGLGFNNYTIEQLVELKGFDDAISFVSKYRCSANRRYNDCVLVRTYEDLFCDCFRAEITTEKCSYHLVVDMEGRLLNPPDTETLMYREWEAGEKLMYEKWEAKWYRSFIDEEDLELIKVEND